MVRSPVGTGVIEFRILGPLEVHEGGRLVPLGGAKQRALLAILLLNANEVVTSDRLIDELWAQAPTNTAAKGLQGYVSGLRKALGGERGRELLVTRPPGYAIELEPEQLDLERFERMRGEARAALAANDPARASAKLREALSLWRGPPLADFAYDPFARAEIDRLEELRFATLEERIEADLALGRHADVVGELEALVRAQPLRERLRGQVMLALYRGGRQAEALQAYREARAVLVEELGIEPGRELRELHEAILRQDPGLQPARPVAHQPVNPAPALRARRGESPPRRGSFVGRDREIAEFDGALEDALGGRSGFLLLAGEPGIGKSRLADEFALMAEQGGAKVLWGRCWEVGGAPAYWPWVQALRAYIRETDRERLRAELGGGAADLGQMVPEVHELFPDLPVRPALDPEGARFRLFDSTASFLRAAAQEQPLVLVLDDMHAADEPSLLLLRFLARELRAGRVVIVVAYRDREAGKDDSLRETLAELHREPITRPLQLGGLDPPEVARFTASVWGTQPSERLTAAIHAETEGNPLFVGELVRLLAAEGRLETAEEADWKTSIPRGLREVIAHRLRHLSADCKEVLAVASVLGREFRLDALERVSQHTGERLLDLLDEAVQARVLGELPLGRRGLRFSHALIRDSLYGDLASSERLRLHRRTAEALEELYGDEPAEYLAELAHHFLEAAHEGDVEKAIDYARRAGDRAAALLAYEEAVRLYGMALAATGLGRRVDDRLRCELLLAKGDAEARAGQAAQAKETFAEAAELARRIDSPEQLARAALGYGGRFVWFRAGSDRRLIALLETALDAQPSGDSVLRARLLARLAGALRDDPVPERRATLSSEAVQISRRAGDSATLAYALEGTYAALSWPEGAAAWLHTAEELTRLAEQAGDRERTFYGRVHVLGASMVRGDLQAAVRELQALTALTEELRQPNLAWALAINRGMLAAFAGRFDEAEELMRQVAEVGAGGQGLDETFYHVMNLQQWAVRRGQGRLSELEGSLSAFVEKYPTWFLNRCALASVYSELGREEAAREQLDILAADDFAALHLGTEWFIGASLLAEVCAALGDRSRAARLYDLLAPHRDYNVISHPEVALGAASRYAGILATTLGRWDDASDHFEHATAMNARMGARPWIAHTQADYARMLRARDRPGDAMKADELTRQAAATYRRLGMESWVERLESLSATSTGT